MFNKEQRERLDNILLRTANKDYNACDILGQALLDALKKDCNIVDSLSISQPGYHQVDVKNKYLKDCRWDIVCRAVEILSSQFKDSVKNSSVSRLAVCIIPNNDDTVAFRILYYYGEE